MMPVVDLLMQPEIILQRLLTHRKRGCLGVAFAKSKQGEDRSKDDDPRQDPPEFDRAVRKRNAKKDWMHFMAFVP